MTGPHHLKLSDGRRLGYQEYGDPDGRPVFFFHGWIGSRLDFAPNDAIARDLGLRVISVDRPGCGESDFRKSRRLLDWPRDVSELADSLGFDRFGLCGHSFGGPYIAACARQLADRVTTAAIVAGISPLSFKGATRGMPTIVRLTLWAGGRAPALVRPWVRFMGMMVKKPGMIRKGIASQLPSAELALLDTPRFDGFFENFGEMVKNGSNGAYWDARAFTSEWGFECADIRVPVHLFYGTADKNVPIQMGEFYRDAIPGSRATFYEDEGHFIMYSRAREILGSLSA
ncbi:MAG: alpha/beta hydrolase [Chloroflexi bacterium]|nr:alpha/beta hydrolase [Chloroflexota bacterium]